MRDHPELESCNTAQVPDDSPEPSQAVVQLPLAAASRDSKETLKRVHNASAMKITPTAIHTVADAVHTAEETRAVLLGIGRLGASGQRAERSRRGWEVVLCSSASPHDERR